MVFAEMHRHRLLSRYDSGVLRLAVSCSCVVQDGAGACQDGVGARQSLIAISNLATGGRYGDHSRG